MALADSDNNWGGPTRRVPVTNKRGAVNNKRGAVTNKRGDREQPKIGVPATNKRGVVTKGALTNERAVTNRRNAVTNKRGCTQARRSRLRALPCGLAPENCDGWKAMTLFCSVQAPRPLRPGARRTPVSGVLRRVCC
jgi:hypothetical protein